MGGIVFVPLTLNYMLHEFGKRYFEKAPNSLLAAMDDRFQVSMAVSKYVFDVCVCVCVCTICMYICTNDDMYVYVLNMKFVACGYG